MLSGSKHCVTVNSCDSLNLPDCSNTRDAPDFILEKLNIVAERYDLSIYLEDKDLLSDPQLKCFYSAQMWNSHGISERLLF